MARDSATTTGLFAKEGFTTLSELDFMNGIRELTILVS